MVEQWKGDGGTMNSDGATLEQRWWNNGTLEQRWLNNVTEIVEQWNSDGGTVE